MQTSVKCQVFVSVNNVHYAQCVCVCYLNRFRLVYWGKKNVKISPTSGVKTLFSIKKNFYSCDYP